MKIFNILRFSISILVLIILTSFALSCSRSSTQGTSITEEEIIVIEEEEEELLTQGGILKGNEYTINEDEIKIEIPTSSLIKDDFISVSKFPNPISEDDDAIFSENIYSINLDESLYFNEPITITLEYDEGRIPEGLSESSLFIAFEYEEGKVFYQGGKIDIENNTITIKTLHTSKWWTGILKKIGRIPNGEVIPEENIDKYSRKRLEYFEEAIQLILDDSNFNNVEYARAEWDRQWEEFLNWWVTANITIEKLEGVNPASTMEELVEWAGQDFTQGVLISIISDMLVQIGLTSGAGVLVIGGTAVGVIGAIPSAIFIGENVAWSVLTIEKVSRMRNASRRLKIISTAWDYLASKGSFLVDLDNAKKLGLNIPQDKADRVLDIIDETMEKEEESDIRSEKPEVEEEATEISKGIILMNGEATYIFPEDYPILITLEIDLDTGNITGNLYYEGPEMSSVGFIDVIIEGTISGIMDLNTNEIYFEADCINYWPSQTFDTLSKWSGKLKDENNSASGTYFFDEWTKGEWSVSK